MRIIMSVSIQIFFIKYKNNKPTISNSNINKLRTKEKNLNIKNAKNNKIKINFISKET